MRRLISAAALAAAVFAGGMAAPSTAVTVGQEGCTPGYWKNHAENWQEANPARPLHRVYSSVALTSLSTVTMGEALRLGGGPGVTGAERILARAATAAWLNAAHDGLGYPWRRQGPGEDGRPALVPTVNAAFASGDRDTMLALAERLDVDNNLGCPLS